MGDGRVDRGTEIWYRSCRSTEGSNDEDTNGGLKVRRSLGYTDEDPKQGLVDTWIEEGDKETGRMKDGSWVGDT